MVGWAAVPPDEFGLSGRPVRLSMYFDDHAAPARAANGKYGQAHHMATGISPVPAHPGGPCVGGLSGL